jgi:hypothetical protein
MKNSLPPKHVPSTLTTLKYRIYRQSTGNLLILILLYSMSVLSTAAQAVDPTHKNGSLMFSMGNGFSYAGKGDQSKAGWGLNIRAAMYYEKKGLLVSIGVARSAGGTAKYDVLWMHNYNSNDLLLDKHDLFFDLGFKIGGLFRASDQIYFTAMTGGAIVKGKRIFVIEEPGIISSSTHHVKRGPSKLVIGIPLEAGINVNLLKSMGIGLWANANINALENYYGFTLNLIFRIENSNN